MFYEERAAEIVTDIRNILNKNLVHFYPFEKYDYPFFFLIDKVIC